MYYHKVAKVFFWIGVFVTAFSSKLFTSYASGGVGEDIASDPFAPLVPLLVSIAAGIIAIGVRK